MLGTTGDNLPNVLIAIIHYCIWYFVVREGTLAKNVDDKKGKLWKPKTNETVQIALLGNMLKGEIQSHTCFMAFVKFVLW